MTHEEFDKILKSRLEKIENVLGQKALEYAHNSNRLYNFYEGARMRNKTPLQIWDGYFTKHLTNVFDLVEGRLFPDPKTIDEKIGDAINYLILLEALLIEHAEDL